MGLRRNREELARSIGNGADTAKIGAGFCSKFGTNFPASVKKGCLKKVSNQSSKEVRGTGPPARGSARKVAYRLLSR